MACHNGISMHDVLSDYYASCSLSGKEFVDYVKENYLVYRASDTSASQSRAASETIYSKNLSGSGDEWSMFTTDKIDGMASIYRVANSRGNGMGFASYALSSIGYDQESSQFKIFSMIEKAIEKEKKKKKEYDCDDDSDSAEYPMFEESEDEDKDADVNPSELSIKGAVNKLKKKGAKKESDRVYDWSDSDAMNLWYALKDPEEITGTNAKMINTMRRLVLRNNYIVNWLETYKDSTDVVDDDMINKFFWFIQYRADKFDDGVTFKTEYEGDTIFPEPELNRATFFDIALVKKKLCKGSVYKAILKTEIEEQHSTLEKIKKALGLGEKTTLKWDTKLVEDIRKAIKEGKNASITRTPLQKNKLVMFTHLVCQNKAIKEAEATVKDLLSKGLPPLTFNGFQILMSMWCYYPTKGKRNKDLDVSKYTPTQYTLRESQVVVYHKDDFESEKTSITVPQYVKSYSALKRLERLLYDSKILSQKRYEAAETRKSAFETESIYFGDLESMKCLEDVSDACAKSICSLLIREARERPLNIVETIKDVEVLIKIIEASTNRKRELVIKVLIEFLKLLAPLSTLCQSKEK